MKITKHFPSSKGLWLLFLMDQGHENFRIRGVSFASHTKSALAPRGLEETDYVL